MGVQPDAPFDSSARPLIWSKLQAPVPRRNVARPDLVERCRQPGARVALIRAPAGWGKSTLLSDWYSTPEEERPFAWLALDREDNDPTRFWRYLIEALRTQHPMVGDYSSATLGAPRVDIVADVLPVLFMELMAMTDQTVLVLDDFHLIVHPEIIEAISYFAEHLPPSLALAVATRSEPLLPLARMRARGELVEIDAAQLGFSHEETRLLLNDLNRLHLPDQAVTRLRERTEGWAAGLYLAALSLRSQEDPESFVSDFAGDDRHVVDYLRTEVMAGQPEHIRDFLRHTAHLDRLCASLCDAVTMRADSGQVLRELESSNAFLVPLDTRREWYRYHHLFGELLRHDPELQDEDLRRDLHRRACAWHRDHGFAAEAIGHATRAGEVTTASQLILDNWMQARDSAQLETLLGWLDALPEGTAEADPRLALVWASTLQESGRREAAEQWLLTATKDQVTLDGMMAGPASVADGLKACHAIDRYFVGDAGGILAVAGEAPERAAAGPGYWRGALLTTVGTAFFVSGRAADAERALDEAVSLSLASEHALAAVHALGWLAVNRQESGDLVGARDGLDLIEAFLTDNPGLAAYYGSAMAHVARGTVTTGSRWTVADAESELERAVELSRRGGARFEVAWGLICLARLHLEAGAARDARQVLAQASAAVNACVDPGTLSGLVVDLERHIEDVGVATTAALPFGEALTDREMAVLRLLPTDLTQREIGNQLYLSFNTVKSHTKSIFRKLGVGSRSRAVETARSLGLI